VTFFSIARTIGGGGRGPLAARHVTSLDKPDPHVFKSKSFVDEIDEIWMLVHEEAIKAEGNRKA
jgi:hypothetical protein